MTTNQERRDSVLRSEVRRALMDTLDDHPDPAERRSGEFSDLLGWRLLHKLRARGLAVHDFENCVRKPWQERAGRALPPDSSLGREMTPDEQIRLGVAVPYDDVPDA
jgi:hypothetical protein